MAKWSDLALVAAIGGGLYILWNMGKDAFTGLTSIGQGISQPISDVTGAISATGQAAGELTQDIAGQIYNAGYATGEATKTIADQIYNAGYATGEATKAALANPDTLSLLQSILGGPTAVASWAAQQLLVAPPSPRPSSPQSSPVFGSTESGTVKEVNSLIASVSPKLKTVDQGTITDLGTSVVPSPKLKSSSGSSSSEDLVSRLEKQAQEESVPLGSVIAKSDEYARLRGWI